MSEPTLEKSLTNAEPVTSVLAKKETWKFTKKRTLEKSLTNAELVTSVLAEQET